MAVKPPTKSRQRKIECPACGVILYGSAAALGVGMPTCACGESMVVANLGDLAVIDPEGFEKVAGTLGEREHNGLMRVLGYDHAVVSTNARSIGTRQCKRASCKRLRVNTWPRPRCRSNARSDDGLALPIPMESPRAQGPVVPSVGARRDEQRRRGVPRRLQARDVRQRAAQALGPAARALTVAARGPVAPV